MIFNAIYHLFLLSKGRSRFLRFFKQQPLIWKQLKNNPKFALLHNKVPINESQPEFSTQKSKIHMREFADLQV